MLATVKRWQDPATVVCIMSPDSYFIDIGDGRVRFVQSCDIISEIDVDFSRALAPATVECDVLPVDRSGIEHLDPGQQVELTDEFAACFSEEPVSCRVRGIWLLFVFLVCGVVVLSMIICLASDAVCLARLFGTAVVLFVEVRGIVSIAVSSRVCVSNV